MKKRKLLAVLGTGALVAAIAKKLQAGGGEQWQSAPTPPAPPVPPTPPAPPAPPVPPAPAPDELLVDNAPEPIDEPDDAPPPPTDVVPDPLTDPLPEEPKE